MKSVIKDTNFIAADWKKNWNTLQFRLAQTITQNNKLHTIIKKLQKKLNDVEISNTQEKEEYRRKISDLHSREINMLKTLQIENLKHLDTAHKKKIETMEMTYQKRFEDLQKNFQTRVDDLKENHTKEIMEKEAEIVRLDSIAQQQCSRMFAEVSALKNQIQESNSNTHAHDDKDGKVKFLHKCISKMDKLFRKSEKEYIKEIEKLKQELEMNDKSLQIQLRTQKAELLAVSSDEKQSYMDEVIYDLESRYMRLLEEQEKKYLQDKKKNEQTIADLKQILKKHDIPYSV